VAVGIGHPENRYGENVDDEEKEKKGTQSHTEEH
jgi:hypothetical protein